MAAGAAPPAANSTPLASLHSKAAGAAAADALQSCTAGTACAPQLLSAPARCANTQLSSKCLLIGSRFKGQHGSCLSLHIIQICMPATADHGCVILECLPNTVHRPSKPAQTQDPSLVHQATGSANSTPCASGRAAAGFGRHGGGGLGGGGLPATPRPGAACCGKCSRARHTRPRTPTPP